MAKRNSRGRVGPTLLFGMRRSTAGKSSLSTAHRRTRSLPTFRSRDSDPVERRLNNPVFVGYPEEATSNPDTFRGLETACPVAMVGGLVGEGSNLFAVEIEEEKKSSSLKASIERIVGKPQCVVGADLLILGSLEQCAGLKDGGSRTETEHLVHTLTAEVSPDCPFLAVQGSDCGDRESLSRTIERLGLLGHTADAVLRLNIPSRDRFPILRRLSRADRAASAHFCMFCALRRGQYVHVRREGAADPGGMPEIESRSDNSFR